MAAKNEHVLKDIKRLRLEYPGSSYYSKKIEKIGNVFVLENVELLKSVSILQKPEGNSSFGDYSKYVVQLVSTSESNTDMLFNMLDKQYGKIQIENSSTIVFEPGFPEDIYRLIQFLKSLGPHILKLSPVDSEKMFSTIYGMLGQLQLCNYTAECLRKGDIEEGIKLNALISSPGDRLTYWIAEELEKLSRTDEAIGYYKKISSSEKEYTDAQYRLSSLIAPTTPVTKSKHFKHLVRSGEQGIPHLDTALLQDALQLIDSQRLKSIVCDKKLDIDVTMHLAEQFDSLAAGNIVDHLCATLHKRLSDNPYRPCIARYNMLLAKRLGTPEEIASNTELQAKFYNHCLTACLASKKYRAKEILIEQMQKDLAKQPVTVFLTNVLKVSLGNTAVFYHAAMALITQERPLLAACLLQRVVQKDSEVYFELAAKQNLALTGITLSNRTDMERIGSCLNICVSTGMENIAESVAKIAANFSETTSVSSPGSSSSSSSNTSSSSDITPVLSRTQYLEKQVEALTSRVAELELAMATLQGNRKKHHSSKASPSVSSSSELSLFSEKSRRSRSSHHSHHGKDSNKHSTSKRVSHQDGDEARESNVATLPLS